MNINVKQSFWNQTIRYFLIVVSWAGVSIRGLYAQEVKEIHINAIPGLQFDVVQFQVEPGQAVRLTFSNLDDMGHNLLFTAPGSRSKVVNDALQLAEKGPRMNYIPELPEVLWALPVIYNGQSQVLEFTAPQESGAYPYVCTYPGHGLIMYGVMYVSNVENMPPKSEDENIPPNRRTDGTLPEADHAAHSASAVLESQPPHPYDLVPPFLYRVFIENSSLASIAVHLPHQLSYCWDATECRLRFAWTGDFLDNTDLWHGHKNAYAKVLGEIFYTDKTAFPLRIGNSDLIPEREFKGYRMVDRYPEFRYLVSGYLVHEIIHPKDDGSGLVRNFRIDGIDQTVWFVYDPKDGVTYETSSGKWEDGRLRLSAKEAQQFTIIMTKTDKR
jgi:azurin